MKLPFEPYTPTWKSKFETLKKDIEQLLSDIQPQVDHIGSTSVEGLSAKPIIDIQLGVKNKEELEQVPLLFNHPNVVYYEKYNKDMPERRFFILFQHSVSEMGVSSILKAHQATPEILQNHDLRIAHIHAFVLGSADWTRHIAFRDYLKTHPTIRAQYQELKQKLVQQEWVDGNHYNDAKDAFLKKYEKIAVDWHQHI